MSGTTAPTTRGLVLIDERHDQVLGMESLISSDRLPAVSSYLRRLNGNSRSAMQNCLRRLIQFLGLGVLPPNYIRWHSMTPDMLDAMCKIMHKHKYSPRSKRLFLSALKGVLRETLADNLISEVHISRALTAIPATEFRVLKSGPFDAEIQIMLSSCDDDLRHQGIRDAAMISLAFDLAMSPSEIAALKVENVDLTGGIICFQRKKLLALKVSGPTIARLRKWISLRNKEIGEDGVLFNRIRKGSKSTLVISSKSNSEPIFSGNIQVSGLTQAAIREAIKSRSVKCDKLIDAASLRNSSERRKKKDFSPEELRSAMLLLDF
jgi:site-specific recombinase XerC